MQEKSSDRSVAIFYLSKNYRSICGRHIGENHSRFTGSSVAKVTFRMIYYIMDVKASQYSSPMHTEGDCGLVTSLRMLWCGYWDSKMF